MITQDFLSSPFCVREEVPILLQRARRGELHVLPLFVDPCNWKNERWLAGRQMWPGGAKALKEHKATKRKALLTEFAQQVLAAVEGPAAPSQSETRFDEPHPTHDLHRLPKTGSLLFGRRDEIKLLDTAWNGGATNIVAFTAGGGVGKSTLARVWTEMLAEDEWRGADRVFAWTFYWTTAAAAPSSPPSRPSSVDAGARVKCAAEWSVAMLHDPRIHPGSAWHPIAGPIARDLC